jgi:hypothetical protein
LYSFLWLENSQFSRYIFISNSVLLHPFTDLKNFTSPSCILIQPYLIFITQDSLPCNNMDTAIISWNSNIVSDLVFLLSGLEIVPLPSFFSALQLGVSFGLLNNLPPFFSPSEADYVVSEQFGFLRCEVVGLTPNPQPGGPGYPSSSGSYPLTCPARVTLPPA